MVPPTKNESEVTYWSNLLKEQETWLRSILSARLESPDEVEEVFQEIGLALTNVNNRPDQIENAIGWLYQVAIRQVFQYRRKAGRYRKLLNRLPDQTIESDPREDDPLVILMRTERVEAIRTAMKQLSSQDREILLLKYLEKKNYQQIAEQLGLSRHAVEHRLVKARKALRKQIASGDDDLL